MHQSQAATKTLFALSLSAILYSHGVSAQVSSIATGGGLTGGPITSTGTVSIADGGVSTVKLANGSVTSAKIADGSIALADINSTQIQRRVSASCAVGSSIRAIAVDGTVSCEVDDVASSSGWSLSGNAGTNSATQFIGTTDEQAFVIRTNNIRSLHLDQSGNTLIGASSNAVTSGVRGAFVAGGTAAGDPYGFGMNLVTDDYGTIAGGSANQAGDNAGTLFDQSHATVGGGVFNRAMGFGSTISGGEYNVAQGEAAAVSGGVSNWAVGDSSSVAGGYRNCAGGRYSWSGGSRARVRAAAGKDLGYCNVGNSGDADGDEGSFAWADAQETNFVSTGPNQFLVRASGGMYFGVNSTVSIPAGRFINTSTGAHLTTGGAWTNASSRALKLGFAEVDPMHVLSKLTNLPITTWRYRDSSEGTHMGPVAEDQWCSAGCNPRS
jgi:hypothetical protein